MRFWAGAARGPVLREKESLHAVMQSLAKNLREFGKKCKSGPVTIKDCCALEKQLVPLLQKCQHLEDPPEWVSNFKTAAARFEQSVSVAGLKWVVDMVKGEGGPKKALEAINDCNPPPSFTFLHDCHALLQQHAFLAKLETPEPTKALPVIAERLKDYATVVTLNREVCQGIMPEADSKMQAFCSAVSENALQVLGHVDSRVSAIKTLTEKYRRCLFYLFRVFLNSFVIFDLDLCIDPHGMISCFSF